MREGFSQADQPALDHFNLCPLLIVVCGSDFHLPVSPRAMRTAGTSSPFQAVPGSLYSTTQMFFLP